MQRVKQDNRYGCPVFFVTLSSLNILINLSGIIAVKNFWLILALLPALASSQELKVRRIEKITGSEKGELSVSGVSPDGKYILASSTDFRGLKLIDLRRKRILDITGNPGSGYEPVYSADGEKIFFRSDEYRERKKYSSLNEYIISTGKTSNVEPLSRGLGSPAISGDMVAYTVEGKRKIRMTGTSESIKGDNGTFLLLEDLVPVLYSGGKRKEIKPNGEGNYIWVSLSPDRKKILYNFRGSSSFISDTAGNILTEIGRLNAPRWINDDLIVGMNDEDDGNRILSSDIICYSMKSHQKYNLTNTLDTVEMYPFPVPGRNKLVFQTLKGELFIIHYKIK
jgi:WD40 repeat protein